MSGDVGRHSCCEKYTLSVKYCSRTIASYCILFLLGFLLHCLFDCLVCFSVAGVVSCTDDVVAIYSNFLTLWHSAE